MKYKGRNLKAPQKEIVAFPRTDIVDGQTVHNDIVFVVGAVLDFSPFDAICPEPQPASVLDAKGTTTQNYEHPEYVKNHSKWATNRFNWMILKSIDSPIPGDLEWSTVDPADPETWGNFQDELKLDAGFTPMQVNYLVTRAVRVNSVDEARMAEAKERFLTEGQRLGTQIPSQKAEASTTPSGEPVSDSGSPLPASTEIGK